VTFVSRLLTTLASVLCGHILKTAMLGWLKMAIRSEAAKKTGSSKAWKPVPT